MSPLADTVHVNKSAERRDGISNFLIADGECLPFPDRTFDTIFSGLLFCSCNDMTAVARELARVIRPGGVMLSIEHEGHAIKIGRIGQGLLQRLPFSPFRHCAQTRQSRAAVEAEGFVQDHIDVLPGLFQPIAVRRYRRLATQRAVSEV